MENTTAKLSKQQKEIIDIIKTGQNILITWWAWSWKSYLLNEITNNHITDLPVTASTWIAAVNVWGTTIHSFAWLRLWEDTAENIAKQIQNSKNPKVRKRIKSLKYLAIDEISMIWKDLFDKLDQVFKIVRKDQNPFWWVQMILIWDFLQLPPINKWWANVEFVFESDAFKHWYFNIVNLKEIFRQEDDYFVSLLNNLRFWTLTDEDLEVLKSRSELKVDESDWISATRIVSHNYQADKINNHYLNEINKMPVDFKMKYSWTEYLVENLVKNCLAPAVLELKIWAQVMMLKNTYHEEW